MNKTVEEHLSRIKMYARKDRQILALFLFGSIARRNSFRDSDIDICLVLMPGSYTPKQLSKKKMEYLTLFNLDIQVLRQLPIYIKRRVIKEGKVLFCRDENKLYDMVFFVIREFADFEHIYRDYLKEVAYAG